MSQWRQCHEQSVGQVCCGGVARGTVAPRATLAANRRHHTRRRARLRAAAEDEAEQLAPREARLARPLDPPSGLGNDTGDERVVGF